MIDGQIVPEAGRDAFRAGRQAPHPVHDRREQPRVRLPAAAARRGRGHARALRRGEGRGPGRLRPRRRPATWARSGWGWRATERWWSRRGCWRGSRLAPGSRPTPTASPTWRRRCAGRRRARCTRPRSRSCSRPCARSTARRPRGGGRGARGAAANAYWAAFATHRRPERRGPAEVAGVLGGGRRRDGLRRRRRGGQGPIRGRRGWTVIERFAAPAPAAAPASRAMPALNDTLVSTEVARTTRSRSGSTPRRRARSPCAAIGWKARATEPLAKDDQGVWSVSVGSLVPRLLQLLVRRRRREDGRSRERAHQAGRDEHRQHADGPRPRDGAHRSAERAARRDRWMAWCPSSTLGGERRLVYTPPGYDAGKERYPVLYLLHGGGDEDSGWSSIGRAGFIAGQPARGAVKALPLVIVMPNGSLPQQDLGRVRARHDARARRRSCRLVAWQARFTSELTKDVIPFVGSCRSAAAPGAAPSPGCAMGGGSDPADRGPPPRCLRRRPPSGARACVPRERGIPEGRSFAPGRAQREAAPDRTA